MGRVSAAFRDQSRALWATIGSFVVGATTGLLFVQDQSVTIRGDGVLMIGIAAVTGVVACAGFLTATAIYRLHETHHMPVWQKTISHLSTLAITLAFGGVAALSVLLGGQLLGAGLQGLELGVVGASVLLGVLCALAGRLSFQSGQDLSTRDVAALLFVFIIVGTIFAMLNEADPTWWQRNYSQLGIGHAAWAFNGTLMIAGFLVATVGSYIGRDLHRLGKDTVVSQLGFVVLAWALAGLGLAGVGWFPVDSQPLPHSIAAFGALAMMAVAAGWSQKLLPRKPFVLHAVTVLVLSIIVLVMVLTFGVPVLSVTGLESIVVVLALLWMSTFVRVVSILVPNHSVVSHRKYLLKYATARGGQPARR